ncbi:MAG: 30S ribosomal protein S8 [Candidatus Omnitrophica bacterium CG11_big_fil_rev_8_21_14_0_20_45_26]|uniref:Small ribosomal subunit protein uS8 n=1 Tax=Candidatus Abzuiibacterium crystallinum TaxID=1974748 RepID=A0A2H0LNG3_9BACT|nr:MAG: 30S ribosomal protein S8 [Candidatus Omnitrophica bacterium CG11_big_fil_rev_8_21_14_0_20_45_26]PIW65096.1 MAG: 30S ribosomal protein S8 [Candidatus Omnitrophica bacterium CG12_big_fil_rev_8_21_14_0_65_45_16]
MGAQTDPIADFLTVIRNGIHAHKERVTTRVSNVTLKIAEILKTEGYIDNFKVTEEGGKRFIRLHLRYVDSKPAIRGLKRISKPGIRYYKSVQKLPVVMGGLGCAIVTTPKGVLTDRQARQQKVGGEIICHVW